MKVFPLALGSYQTNCYILSEKGRAIVVDPGDDVNRIIKHLKQHQLELEAIVITHGHFDHIGALQGLLDIYPVPVIIHEQEIDYLTNPDFNFSARPGRTGLIISNLTTIKPIREDGNVNLLGQTFNVRHIPGHSRGSIVLYNQDNGFVLVGDVLFKSSIGRSDFVHGNHDLLISGIKSKLLDLPDDTIVYPGHGGATLIGTEKRTNPFL